MKIDIKSRIILLSGRGTGRLTYIQKIYNYRQARGRRVIENTFGIFANVWGIFRTEIRAEPDIVDRIVTAAVCLHNFRIIENENIQEFLPSSNPTVLNQQVQLESISLPIFGDEIDENVNVGTMRSEDIRNELAEYFIGGGSVYWQDSLIH